MKNFPPIPSKLSLELPLLQKLEVQTLPAGDFIPRAERLVPELQKICATLSQKLEELVSCQVQRTSPKAQTPMQGEFRYLLVYQLSGNTTWFFPQLKNNYVRDYSLFQSLNKALSTFESETTTLELAPGELLWVPYGITQSLKNDGSIPSVQLRFAMEEFQQRDFEHFVGSKLLLLENVEARFYEEVRPEMFTGLNATPQALEEELTDYIQALRLQKYKGS